MGTTETIANFIIRTTAEDIPPEVFKHAKRHVIDTLGVAIGATSGPLAKKLATLVAGQGTKNSRRRSVNGNCKSTRNRRSRDWRGQRRFSGGSRCP